jgi:2-oxoglutarate dehydrogenase E1 component
MSQSDDPISIHNLEFIEDLQHAFLRDPESVPADWRRYFEDLPAAARPPASWRRGPSFPAGSLFRPSQNGALGPAAPGDLAVAVLQDRVDQLVRAYRILGHTAAALDPLGLPRPVPEELSPAFYGLSDDDLERTASSRTIPGAGVRTVRGIIEHLRDTYCRSIGVQYMHIDDLQARWWLRDRMESTANRIELNRDAQVRILTRLTSAVMFEEFIQRKFTGAKSFSLEGAESLIPLLDLAIEKAGALGADEVVLAMAHRGRLNVLANIMGKSPQRIFQEFSGDDPLLHLGRGDVKYHLGHSSDWTTAAGRKIHLSLCFNPSHLEFVNPVALGRLRAKQDRAGDVERSRGLAILIHGEAAFAGEGIVQETLNLSALGGYSVGGTLHVVVNNQIGFTTTPQEGRSSAYATAVAQMLQVPVFHVNGEDPEAVAQVVDLALDFRGRFGRDVVIDMYCYRRRGHNETDDASFTQPVMARAIEARRSVRHGYLEHLQRLGGVSDDEAQRIETECRERLEAALAQAWDEDYRPRPEELAGVWSAYAGGPVSKADEVHTGVEREKLAHLLETLSKLPEGFTSHPKVQRLLEARLEMARGGKPLDWSSAEALALATLAATGHRVRLSGQDSARGTFSQRHAVLHDHEDGRAFTPLQHLEPGQAPVEILNSPLSEAGVLGFEYGYSLDCPDGLVMWEAQFGDFVNAAQVIIDQFIVSAEDKWRRLNGLVLLLPHGFEGMGPEHSSARLERFLMLAAEDNIQVAYPTTPAQLFHLLRRQVLRRWRKPLVVMTPKSLLRHPLVVSSLDDCAGGSFRRVIPDPAVVNAKPRRVLLCTGKVYYDLLQERESRKRADVPIVRVEEIYPFPARELEAALAPYGAQSRILWVQEEPENMGAWRFMRQQFAKRMAAYSAPEFVGRPESASPATGSANSHRLEQELLLAKAMG